MKEKMRAAVCGAGIALLCLLVGMEILSFIRVKSTFIELGDLLHTQHGERMKAVLNLEEAVSAGFECTAEALNGLETIERSLSECLYAMNRQFSSDLAAVRRGQTVLAAALKETDFRPQDPRDDLFVQSLFRKGQDSFAAERYGEAAVSLSEVLSLVPDFHEARLIRAAALYRENPLDSERREEIRADLAVVLTREPHNILALATLGSIALEEQDWPRARRYCRHLIEVDDRNIEAARMFVVACRGEGCIEEAEEEITLLLEDDPDNPRYLLYRGEVLENQKKYGQALASYEAACRRDPAYFPALLGAARTAANSGNYPRARELLSSPSVPKNYETCSLLGECCIRLGEDDDAVSWWKRAAASLTLNTPEDTKKAADCYLKIARYSSEAVDFEGALRAAAKGLRLSENPELHLIRAKALLETGRKDEAQEELSLVFQSEEDPRLTEEARELLERLAGEDG